MSTKGDQKNHMIVGLGGTGGKIIREIRNMIERDTDAQGRGLSEARFEFLYVDTSTDQLEKKDEWKVLGRETDLARSQILIGTANAIRPVLEDPGSFPGLMGFLPGTYGLDRAAAGFRSRQTWNRRRRAAA